jgi:copper transport protein
VLAALAAGAGLLLWAPGASAHALLASSEPADGATVPEAPERVILEFTEAPDPGLTDFQVLDPSGAAVSTEPGTVGPQPTTVTMPVGDLPEGVYTVTWRVVSRVDGHTTAGAFAFGVGVDPGEAATEVRIPASPPPSPWEIAGRWLLFVGLGLLVGVAWTATLAFPEPPRAAVLLARWAWGASLVGVVALGAGQMVATGASLGAFLGSSVGTALILRGIAVLVAGAGLVAAQGRRVRIGLLVGGAAAALAILVHVTAGHANATGGLRAAKVAAQWVHVVAGGVWLGGLAAVLVGVRGEPSDRKAAAVRRFSAVAGVALFAVLGTGVVRAVNEVPSWGALFSTLYGRLVLVKVGLLIALAALGAVNRYRNVRRAGRNMGALRRVSRAELVLGAIVLVAAAVLSSVAPRPERVVAAPPPGIEARGTDFARTVGVRLRATPGTAGSNTFRVRIADPSTGEPLDAERVALEFSYLGPLDVGTSVLELRRAGSGTYSASGTNVSLAGRWEVDVLVQRAGDSVEVPVRLGTLCGARPIGQDPTLWNVETSTGTVQHYLDPAVPGRSEVHVTYFDDAGGELPIDEAEVVATGPGGHGEPPEARRLSAGHFVAPVDLESGRWRFDFTGTTADGALLPSCFEETI